MSKKVAHGASNRVVRNHGPDGAGSEQGRDGLRNADVAEAFREYHLEDGDFSERVRFETNHAVTLA
jgi:hypothetical protein